MMKGADSLWLHTDCEGVSTLKHGSHGAMSIIDMIINRVKFDALSDIDNNDPVTHTINAVQTLNDLVNLENILDIISVH